MTKPNSFKIKAAVLLHSPKDDSTIPMTTTQKQFVVKQLVLAFTLRDEVAIGKIKRALALTRTGMI